MGIMDSIKDFISPVNDDDNDYEIDEEEVKGLTKYENMNDSELLKKYANAKLVIFEPRSFEDIHVIGGCLKKGKSCVINLHKLRPELAQRFIDFLSGVCFVINGTIQKIGPNIILCAPANTVVNTIKEDDENDDEE